MLKKYLSYIGLMSLPGLLGGCGLMQIGVVNKGYHNTAAHYNAYFIAQEKIDEVQRDIISGQEYNFTKPLQVLPLIDSSMIDPHDEDIQKAIEMASTAITRHETSKWVDDAYYLIGLSRYYSADFPNAIKTFKYINTTSDDDATRHKALAQLIRTFVDYGEEKNAIAVIDYLRREELNRENSKRYHLQVAHLHHLNEDYDQVIEHLKEAAPLLKRKEGKSRIYFILGQLYQLQDMEAEAYRSYRKALKSSKMYEFSFYSKISLAQVSEAETKEEIKKMRKFFSKMLKDEKNEEYRDKIYYEMANFEGELGNLDQAIDYYQQSARVSVNNPRQKSYSYLKLGQIFYEEKDFSLAKSYYDSVISVMPNDEEDYERIKRRSEILTEFVTHYTTVQTQDSLLQLAEMDTAARYQLFSELYQERREAEKEQQKADRRARAAATYYNPATEEQGFSTGITQDGEWYFYNESMASRGVNQFKREWGDRPLTDFWRISSVASKALDQTTEASTADSEDKPQEGQVSEATRKPSSDVDEKLTAYQDFLNELPLTDQEKQEALSKIEEAMYHLGNIYNLKLMEKENAEQTFTEFLVRFDTSQHRPEVLYQLYLIRKELQASSYIEPREELLEEHPESIFAKLVINPNYREEKEVANAEAKRRYEAAYRLFQQQSYDSCRQLIETSLENYPESNWADYFKILDMLIIGEEEGVYKYQYALDQFIENNPESPILAYAQRLRKATEDYQEYLRRIEAVKYVDDPSQKHYMVVAYSDPTLADELSERIKSYLSNTVGREDLKVGSLILNDEYSLLLITEFPNSGESERFYKKFHGESYPLYTYSSEKFKTFVVSKDNFQIFYQNKELESYLNFFKEKYAL